MQYQLKITGMHCASCITGIEGALKNFAGVKKAEVNFVKETATVEAAADINAGELIKVIEKCGYRAALIDDQVDQQAVQQQAALAHYHATLKRSIVAAIVGIPLFSDLFFSWLPSLASSMRHPVWIGIAIIVFLAMIYSGRDIYQGAWGAFKRRRASMDTLVALGTLTAFIYSLIVVLFPYIMPATARHVYFDTAILLLAFINLGAALEVRARGKTSSAIAKLMQLQPKTATLIDGGITRAIHIKDIKESDILLLRPGEKVAVDGVVVKGDSHLDEAMLTGEPIPVHKKMGDAVMTGTINGSGSLQYQAQKVGSATMLAQIIKLVENAQNARPAIARLADTIASVFVPVVLIIAVITALIWFNFGPLPVSSFVLTTTISVLVIACPCALGLATPIAVMVGVGLAAEKGVLIKNGEALQKSGKLTHIVLDKTGTITAGKPTLNQLINLADINQAQLLTIVASLEANSEHPLAMAIINAARMKKLNIKSVIDFKAISGFGIKGCIANQTYFFGNLALMKKQNININVDVKNTVDQLSAQGDTVMYLSDTKQLLGIVSVNDPVKEDSKVAIKQLQKMNLTVVMLSGDQQKTAVSVAKKIGINDVIAEVLPQDKAQVIKGLQAKGYVVAMVGDGINDAAALAQSDVGLAIGSGADIAIESADIALMGNSLTGIVQAIYLSRATLKTIYQNLFGAFVYNALGIPIAAGILYPLTGMLLSPLIAGAAMAASSLTVVLNALRLRVSKH